jgi:hypothetical protein
LVLHDLIAVGDAAEGISCTTPMNLLHVSGESKQQLARCRLLLVGYDWQN